jgi:deoxyuridine 5''-triphosphate nucleotidohydrolase (dut)
MPQLVPVATPVNVQLLRNAAALYGADGLVPATNGSAGIDLRACFEDAAQTGIAIAPGSRAKIPTGLRIEPRTAGIAGFVYSRSGLGAVKGLVVAQGVGLIDPDYRGEIMVFLLNTGTETHTVAPGERIAQIVFQPFFQANFQVRENLGDTARGDGGFGHTGR